MATGATEPCARDGRATSVALRNPYRRREIEATQVLLHAAA
jgi:hypothetical protein